MFPHFLHAYIHLLFGISEIWVAGIFLVNITDHDLVTIIMILYSRAPASPRNIIFAIDIAILTFRSTTLSYYCKHMGRSLCGARMIVQTWQFDNPAIHTN